MNRLATCLLGFTILLIAACAEDNAPFEVVIPDFDFPETIEFEQQLSSYDIFQGAPSNLKPTPAYHLLELSSILFTDYAHKQRLVKLPPGTEMQHRDQGVAGFPDGSILVKTFFYYIDERDTSLGKRLIETRLLIKEAGTWNIATYLWNESQDEATLKLDGHDTPVSWIDANGNMVATNYHVPTQNECITCHQLSESMTPIGPSLRNLNRSVERDGAVINQLSHLQAMNLLEEFPISEVDQIVNYKDESFDFADRSRAYLDLNCAHCHNPEAWDVSSRQRLDLRYEIPLALSGILEQTDEISRLVSEGEMPFIGTTLLDEQGVAMVLEYIEGL